MRDDTRGDVLRRAVRHLKESLHAAGPEQLDLTKGLGLLVPAPFGQVVRFRIHASSLSIPSRHEPRRARSSHLVKGDR
jgi:hypothetical protein